MRFGKRLLVVAGVLLGILTQTAGATDLELGISFSGSSGGSGSLTLASRSAGFVDPSFYTTVQDFHDLVNLDDTSLALSLGSLFQPVDAGLDTIQSVLDAGDFANLTPLDRRDIVDFVEVFDEDLFAYETEVDLIVLDSQVGSQLDILGTAILDESLNIINTVYDIEDEILEQSKGFIRADFENAVDAIPQQLIDEGLDVEAANFERDMAGVLEKIEKVSSRLDGLDQLSDRERLAVAAELEGLDLELGYFRGQLFDLSERVGNLDLLDPLSTVDAGIESFQHSIVKTLDKTITDSADEFLKNEFGTAINSIPGTLQAAGFQQDADDVQARIPNILNRVDQLTNRVDAATDLGDSDRIVLVTDLEELLVDIDQFNQDLSDIQRRGSDAFDILAEIDVVTFGLEEVTYGIVDALDDQIYASAEAFFGGEFDNAVEGLPDTLEAAGLGGQEAVDFRNQVVDLVGRIDDVQDALADDVDANFSVPELTAFVGGLEDLEIELTDLQVQLDGFGDRQNLAPNLGNSIEVVQVGLDELAHVLIGQFEELSLKLEAVNGGFGNIGDGDNDGLLANLDGFDGESEKIRDVLGRMFPGQQDNLLEQMKDDTDLARKIVREVDKLVDDSRRAFEFFDTEEARAHAIGTVGAVRRHVANRGPVTAGGDLLHDLELSVSVSYAKFDNKPAGGNGTDEEQAFQLSGMIGDDLLIGLGASHSRYRISGAGLERHSQVMEGYVIQDIADWLAVGGFMSYADIDLERHFIDVINPLTGITTKQELFGEQYGRWGAGVLATVNRTMFGVDFGLSTSLSSTNKESLDRMLDDEDTVWVTLADARWQMNDHLALSGLATYFTLIDNEATADPSGAMIKTDGSFWIIGAEVELRPWDHIGFSVGYETVLGENGVHEDRVNAAITYSW